MRTKLTLYIDAELIARAKVWAKSRDMSLSDAVANMFAAVPYEDVEPKLHARTRQLVGLARTSMDAPAPSDDEIRRGYVDYLAHKHR